MKSRSRRWIGWLSGCFLAILAVLIFWPWFTPGFISYGDWWYNLPSRVIEYYRHFLIWDGGQGLGSGLGVGFGNNVVLYWTFWLMGFMQSVLGVAVSVTTRLIWFVPYVIFAFFGGWYLGWKISGRHFGALVTSIVYATSTFVMLDVQGGHLPIALSYALAPLALGLLINVLRNGSTRSALWLGVILALAAICDVRITYISLISLVGFLPYFYLYEYRSLSAGQRKNWRLLFLSLVVGAGISAYWAIHIFFIKDNGVSILPSTYDSVSWLTTLSYAKLSNTLAANHVWWPWSEGQVHPIYPLLLFIPFLALIGLCWKKNRPIILYFFAVYLLGAFLAKGINPPAGDVYVWLFTHLPGFSFFRDPAKLFTLVMIGLAPAAGLGAVAVLDWIRPRMRLPAVLVILLLLLWPQRPFLFGERHGTFITHTLPKQSAILADWLDKNKDWGRILWVPIAQRFIPPSQTHPLMDYKTTLSGPWLSFANLTDPPLNFLKSSYAGWLLAHQGVKYIGLPYDSEDEIYRYFGPQKDFSQVVANLPYVKGQENVGGSLIFSLDKPKPEVYIATNLVAIDAEALPENNHLPALADSDALLITDSSGQNPLDDISKRLEIKALTLLTDEPFISWLFKISQNYQGPIGLDTVFFGQPVKLDGQSITDSQTVSLAAGDHQLMVNLSRSEGENIWSGKSANEFTWNDCITGKGAPDTNLIKLDDGSVSLAAAAGKYAGCALINIGQLDQGYYRLTFDWEQQGNIWGRMVLTDPAGKEHRTATKSDGLQTSIIYFARRNASGAGEETSLKLLAFPVKRFLPGQVILRRLTLTRVLPSEPRYITIGGTATTNDSPAVLAVDKLSTREYRVKLAASQTPFVLVLNQAFSPGWKIKGETADHFTVNGGLNGWRLAPSGERTIELVYASVWPYYLGFAISFITIGFVLIYRLISKRRRNV